jgi:hypothetical protein
MNNDRTQPKRRGLRPAAAAILLAAMLTAGCTNDSASQIDALETPTPEATAAEATATNTSAPDPTPTNTPRPTPRPTPTPIPENISLGESGFAYYTDSSGSRYGGWFVEVRNESPVRGVHVHLQAVFYDDAGIVIETDTTRAGLFPGQEITIGEGFVSFPAAPVHMEVRQRDVEFFDAQTDAVLEVRDAAFEPGRFGSNITGIVSSPYSADLERPHVLCIAFDSAGDVLAVATDRLDLLPAGGSARAECRLSSGYALGGLSYVEIHAYFGWLTSIVD